MKGDECAFSHCTQFQKKAELCRHYLTGSCKKTSCQFYHDILKATDLIEFIINYMLIIMIQRCILSKVFTTKS